jgi:aminoglycoside 2''-phosphotransferase
LDRSTARAAIGESFPEVPLRSVRTLPGGWDFLTLEVDHRWVFRVPARPDSEERIRREFALLPLFASRLGVPVPDYRFRHEPSHSFRHRFGGYPKLPGVPVDRAGLSPRALARTGRELGRTLRRLHRIPAKLAAARGLPYRTAAQTRAGVLRWRSRVRTEVRPILSVAARERLDALLGRIVRPELHSYETVVTHNDLLPAHLLVDPRSGAISGLIDWGDVEFGDPAFDLGVMGSLSILGPAMYRAYGGPSDPGFLERADAYRRLVPSHGVIFGTHTGDDALRSRSLRRLERALASRSPRS